jgi:hypothetical protein
MKKLELKVLLKEQEERLQELEYGYSKIKEYIAIRKQIGELQGKVKIIEREWYDENQESARNCRAEIREYKELIAYKGQLTPKNYCEAVQKCYDTYFRGTTSYDWRQLVWVSEDQKYCLLKMPSHSEYTDRMSGVTSSPSEWVLVECDVFQNNRNVLVYSTTPGVLMKKDGGRWSKRFEQELIEIINKQENERLI